MTPPSFLSNDTFLLSPSWFPLTSPYHLSFLSLCAGHFPLSSFFVTLMPPFLFAPSRITTWEINLRITLSFTITWVIKTIITILFFSWIKHCIDILLGFFFSYVTSGSNLVPLCWSCVLVRRVYSNTDLCNDAQWNRLVSVQCLVLYGVLSAGTAPVCASARKKLHKVWREVWFTLLICVYWYVISSVTWRKGMMPPPQASQWLSLGTDLPWVETIEKC